MNTAGYIAFQAASLVLVGFCIGVGLWGAKKMTAPIDEALVYRKLVKERE